MIEGKKRVKTDDPEELFRKRGGKNFRGEGKKEDRGGKTTRCYGKEEKVKRLEGKSIKGGSSEKGERSITKNRRGSEWDSRGGKRERGRKGEDKVLGFPESKKRTVFSWERSEKREMSGIRQVAQRGGEERTGQRNLRKNGKGGGEERNSLKVTITWRWA